MVAMTDHQPWSELDAKQLWEAELGAESRSVAWRALLLGGLAADELAVRDAYEILSQTPCSYDDVIRRDIGRTLPQEELFRERFGKGQSALFRLLRALAGHLWDIGYVQSLNFIVATLINVFPDDEALVFSCAQSLLFRHSLADFYRPSFPKLGVVFWQFDRLVEGLLPKAHAALEAHGVTAEYYAMQWFLTLFASDLPQKTVLRIWDQFLLVGWQVIAQVALALLAEVEDELCDGDSCEAMILLKKFARVRRFEAESLLRSATQFEVSHRMLSDLEAAYSRGDLDNTRLVAEEDDQTGTLRWSVQRGARLEVCRIPSTSSRGSNTSEEPLPRAFDRGGLASVSQGRVDDKAISCSGSVLPFTIHNLDTGETTVLENEWSEYMREEQLVKQPSIKVSPVLFGQLPRWVSSAAPPNTKATKDMAGISRACGGSFWMQSQQTQALRALGKA